jgi:hypothetical protein
MPINKTEKKLKINPKYKTASSVIFSEGIGLERVRSI